MFACEDCMCINTKVTERKILPLVRKGLGPKHSFPRMTVVYN